jgi:HlyD family secretion protein
MKKRIVWTVSLVIILAAGSWGGYRYYNKEDKQTVASYSTATVRKGAIEVKISGTGSIQPSARQTLKASTSGTAAKVNYIEGDTVKKGDVLVTYEEDDITNQINSKNIELKKKNLELTNLQTKYKSAEDDDARQELVLSIQKQQLDIEIGQEEIAELKANKSIDPILAPIDGVLATFNVEAGDSINPNSELGEIVNFAQLQIVVGVDELDISKVKLDQEAVILVEALPDETYTGKVVAIADEGTASNGVASFNVTVALLNITNLKVGMSAEASIMTDKKTDALYVPVEAVQSSQGQYFVLVPNTGTSANGQAARGNTGQVPQKTGQAGQTGAAGQESQAPQAGQGATGPEGQAPQAGQGAARPEGQAPVAGQTGAAGEAGQTRPGGNFREGMQNMTDEERAAMREQFGAGRGAGGAGAPAGGQAASSTGTTRVAVEVGINNEDNIEIVSGLAEGDVVILPTVTSTSSSNNQTGFPGMTGGGFTGGGGGGFPGGGGAGAFTGGGGR